MPGSPDPRPPAGAPPRAGFVRAFVESALGTGLSRVLGALRDMATAALLGAGAESDAFTTAWQIPNLFRRFVADEGLTGALIPALRRAEADGGDDAARALADAVWGALLAANLALCVSGMLLARPLVLALAWEWRDDPAQLALATGLTRALFPMVTMFSMVSYYEALLNDRGHFFLPKVAQAFVNLGIVAGAGAAALSFTDPLTGLCAGTLAGGLVHVAVHWPVVSALWGRLRPRIDLADPRVRAVASDLGKVVGLGIFAQINVIVVRQLATGLGPGVVTHYWNANRLTDLAQGIVAVGIGSALLPGASAAIAASDWGRLRSDLLGALRLALFFLLPTGVFLVVFAIPTTSVLFRRGAYTWEDTLATASALRFMTPFILSVGGINILRRVYFALGDRRTLLWSSAVAVSVTAVSGFALVGGGSGVAGLSGALSISTFVQLAIYTAHLRWRLGDTLPLGPLAAATARLALATAPLGGVLALGEPLADWAGGLTLRSGLVYVGVSAAAGAAYLAAAALLGVPELGRFTAAIRRRFGRRDAA